MAQTLSVVVPCYNEQDVLRQTHDRLLNVLRDIGEEFHIEHNIIYVNDGSKDRTLEILLDIQRDCPSAKVISLSRNFGHQIAVTAGLDHSEGDAVVIIDADLQDPPELIRPMIERWREGYSVVYAQRERRAGETRFKLWTAHFFYLFLNRMSDIEIPRDTGDFRLIDREVVLALRRMPERARFLRGMVSWVGFPQVAVPYTRHARAAGESKYPIVKMVRFAVDGILSFSTRPLRLAVWLGLLAAGLAVVGIFYAIFMRVMTEVWVSGWTLLFIAVLFMGGMQLLVLGVIGEYIGRLYAESRNRPLYLIARRWGFEAEATPADLRRVSTE
jgi:polyisoprenyl-phosphate glycosyltransferase